MSDRYKGGILSGTAPTVTPQSANGVYTASQQYQYQGQGVWPTAAQNPILQSLRFRSSATAYLNRTPASASNRRTWTWSGWVKRGTLSTSQRLFNAYSGDENNTTEVGFDATNNIIFSNVISSSQANGFYGQTSAVFRDPSAWYHIVFSVDTTQSTATAALKVYVNGVQQTLGSSSYGGGTNQNTWINDALPHRIGQTAPPNSAYFDGYLAETNFIDGQALTPSSFGTTDVNGIWQPTPYTGTYGTNGFYLPFSDKSALTTSSNVGLGKDFSGNGNYWTTNNISITAGATYDPMLDSPSNASSTIANYAVLNPNTTPAGAGGAFSTQNANLQVSMSYVGADSTIAMSNGKWYWEVTPTSGASSYNSRIGIVPSNHGTYSGTSVGDGAGTYGYASTGQKGSGGTYTAYGSSYTDNDIIGVALDMDNGTITFYKNNVSQGVAYSGLTGTFLASTGSGGSGGGLVLTYNFGQRPFAYTPPTGFNRLNTYNLPVPTIPAGNKQMDATLYTGTGATQSITNSGSMQPDLVWIKSRSTVGDTEAYDSVRGTTKYLLTDSTNAEGTGAQSLTAFNSNGFSLGTGAGVNSNTNGTTYVGWQWKAGGTAVTNTAGTISSQVSANTTSGFSVVTWTAPTSGSAPFTFGHGLGVAPAFIILKSRNSGGWNIYHQSLGNATSIQLNTTGASFSTTGYFNSTSPTPSVVTVGSSFAPDASATPYVAYCWAQIAGYSAFGSYTGNGSTDGPFVFTGFRPKFVLLKCSSATESWYVYDSARDTYNVVANFLVPNQSIAEANFTSLDFLSNGFKLRTSNSLGNTNGATYIYMAFAENPFKMARAR